MKGELSLKATEGLTGLSVLPESAMPTDDFQKNSGKPKTLAASIYGGQGSSRGCAAAGACRLSLPDSH